MRTGRRVLPPIMRTASEVYVLALMIGVTRRRGRVGRTAVLNDLWSRQPLYATAAAAARWESAAKANLAGELRSLR